tara:strand:- start:2052 stop:2561 length:510 start_codon:yes stop_codon:yes gene_type:complete
MGGQGSGRRPDFAKKFAIAKPTQALNHLELPNLSGVKHKLKNNLNFGTPGGIIYVGSTGNYEEESTTFFWDTTNKTLIVTDSGGNIVNTMGTSTILGGGTIGTTSAHELNIMTNNTPRIIIASAGFAAGQYDQNTADISYIPNVLYGTDATPPTASTTTRGSIYIQYTA